MFFLCISDMSMVSFTLIWYLFIRLHVLTQYIVLVLIYFFFFFCKQKTAYVMRISDWSSDVCSSDLEFHGRPRVVLDTDVAMAVDGVATFRAYQSDRFLGCGFDDIGDNHIRAPTGKNKGGSAADTAACARHDIAALLQSGH